MSLVSRRFLRLSVTVGIILILIFGGLHIWFRYNAKQFLIKKVHDESQGKFSLELKGFSFNYLTNYIEVRKASLISTDTISQAATYNVQFNKLSLHVSSFIPLLIQRKLLLDSVKIYDPHIQVTRWRPDTSTKTNTADVSIPREMGKMYNSLLDALDAFGIKRIVIDNGRFSLINKMIKDQQPVVITNVHLNLVRTAEAPEERDIFVKGKQTVDLSTRNQSIRLPNGRHILSFKSFELQLFRKHIQLDSCIIVALPSDSTNSSYTIFFDKLLLVGVDFNAMYERNLIRADSVYVENPVFNINLDLKNSTAANKTKPKPDPEKIIREITGDLELGFVGVKSAGIRINITGDRTRTLSNSKKDDFKMYGLKINQDSEKPVTVDRFDMVVRDYKLYSADSASAYGFDSIHFVNNKVILNNFTVATSVGTKGLHNERDFKVPYFELTGLDWYELIFNETVKAREAVLFNPIINYTRRAPAKKRIKVNVFQTLETLDSLMVLNKIRVINGTLNMKMGATAFNLQNTNLDLNSSRLLQSDNITDVRNAVQALSFSNGAIRFKDNLLQLTNVRYTGNNLVEADKLKLTSTSNKINATAGNVLIKNMFINEKDELIIVDGIGWKFAQIKIRSEGGKAKTQNQSGSISIKNLSGFNTQLNITTGKTTVSTFLESIKLSSLIKSKTGAAQLEGLAITGNKLSINSNPLQINSSNYQINSSQPSYLNQFSLIRNQPNDSLEVKSPRITFVPDVNAILTKDIHVHSIEAQAPIIKMSKWNTGEKKEPTGEAPSIRIDRIMATNPSIYIATHRNDSVGVINLPRTASNSITATDLLINKEGTAIGTLAINTTTGSFAKRNGEIIGVDNGKIDVQFANIRLNNTGAKPFWSVLVNQFHLQNPNALYLGPKRNQLFMQEASVGNVQLSSELVTDYSKLIRFNVSAWLRTATGQYIDSSTTLKWFNAGYDSRNKTLSLDSFIYHPTQSLDSVVANTPFQTDYITLQTGPLQITDFNLEKYNKDSAIIANTVNIQSPVITIHRDKRPPFLGGIIKPLPVNMIKAIAVPVSLQRVNVINGNLSYTEVNEKTGAEGTVLLTHLNGSLGNIKNRNINENDSLSLILNAYLMDSALLNLRVKESYTDSLAGFLMTLRMRPTSLTFLNPVLAPLSNVQIVSGTIDSFHLRAIGRETLSLGEMNMYYRNLRIKLVKDGDPNKSTFLLDVASFLANTFVIKKNNNGRTGIVYFERLRDRSFFNYIVKMTFSGMATSVGAKKNRKYLKKYRQELKDQRLPAIEFE